MLEIIRSPEEETAFYKLLSDYGRCKWIRSASLASFQHYTSTQDFMRQVLIELDKIRESNTLLEEMLVELRRMRVELMEINKVQQEKANIFVTREG